MIQSDTPLVGICVLNYHHPEETLACVQSLLNREPSTSRILWLENDAQYMRERALQVLAGAQFPWVEVEAGSGILPPEGTVGVVFNEENLGYAGGNNVGLRILHRAGVPYVWILNNDTLLLEGSSQDLVRAAEFRPEVGAWGTTIRAQHTGPFRYSVDYFGGIVSMKDFSIALAQDVPTLDTNPHSYVSGCSLFARTEVLAEIGWIPDDYFLYYEDPAVSIELRKRGYRISAVPEVVIDHIESLSTGRRSPLMEFYNRRNRWYFIERYYPEHLGRQKRRMWYTFQKYAFRLKTERIQQEWWAYKDYKARCLGRTTRDFSRVPFVNH